MASVLLQIAFIQIFCYPRFGFNCMPCQYVFIPYTLTVIKNILNHNYIFQLFILVLELWIHEKEYTLN